VTPYLASRFDPRRTFVFAEDGGDALCVEVTPTFWKELTTGDTSDAGIRRIREGGGWLVGMFHQNAGGGWEMHPAGDEILYLLSGAINVILAETNGERVIELQPGSACVVPRGTWHRQIVHAPSDLFAITYGKGTQHRPLN
jgi:mannose-6-phosphate isomerase-like protein (cupin superfamily)